MALRLIGVLLFAQVCSGGRNVPRNQNNHVPEAYLVVKHIPISTRFHFYNTESNMRGLQTKPFLQVSIDTISDAELIERIMTDMGRLKDSVLVQPGVDYDLRMHCRLFRGDIATEFFIDKNLNVVLGGQVYQSTKSLTWSIMAGICAPYYVKEWEEERKYWPSVSTYCADSLTYFSTYPRSR